MKTNIIGIHTMSVSTEMMQFAESGVYRTVPMIIYKINEEKVQHFAVERPIEIFRESMNYRTVKNIVKNEEKDISFLAIPGKAYNMMQQYANQNVNKVIADMITHVVVSVIKELKEKDADSHNIFFIDTMDTNKIIGRLGYLYLENESNTIAFVTYKAGGLLTNVLNGGSTRLEFDINYFKRSMPKAKDWSEIIPNDFMESLTQAVFFNIPDSNEKLSPLRCDILSQGLSKIQIKRKVEKIYKVLESSDNMTLPFAEKSGNSGDSTWIRMPRALYDCIEAADKIYRDVAQVILEG